MTDRETILGRIREALTLAAPKPGEHGGAKQHKPRVSPGAGSARQWLPAVGKTFEEHAALFRANSAELKTDFHLVNTRDELAARLREVRDREGWQRIASHGGELTDAACETLGLPVCQTDTPYDVRELEKCDA